jgi:hypothetical protein
MKFSVVSNLVIAAASCICSSAIAQQDGGGCPNSEAQFNAIYKNYQRMSADVDGNGTGDVVLVGAANVFICLRGIDGLYKPERVIALQYAADTYKGYSVALRDKNKDGVPDLVFEGGKLRFWYAGTRGGPYNSNRQEEPI